jgi:hypothetical protein
MILEHYLAHRRIWEVAGVVLLLSIGFVTTLNTEFLDLTRYGVPNEFWEVAVWEATSHIALGITIPLLLWFDHRFPIRMDTLPRSLIAHALFTPIWSLTHVILMYSARVTIYRLVDDRYFWEDWWAQFGYEYLKDVQTYIAFVAIIYLYRFVLRRLQGEAGYVTESETSNESTDVTDRFLIKKLGREFLVRVEDIDWIEASGNYVNLHVGGKVYPLRETMTGITDRLHPQGFQRVHRSAIINLERIAEIVPFDSGDGEARLSTDAEVPVSRRYKKELRERLSPAASG